jgi:hypothetical protein
MNGIEANNHASPIPDFDGTSIEVLLRLIHSGLIVGAFQDRGRSSDAAVTANDKDAIFLHVSTSCMSDRSQIYSGNTVVQVRFQGNAQIFSRCRTARPYDCWA